MRREHADSPPALALRLLGAILPPAERESFVGDLVEEFHAARLPRLGRARARRWFWRETLAAVATLRPTARVPHAPSRAGDPLVLSFLADLRHGARLLRRAPAFTLLATLTLGLGIGGATAIYSVVNPVLLRALPYPDAERLVTLWERGADGSPTNVGFATFADVAAGARSLEHAAAVGDWQPTLSGAGDAERLGGARVTWGYFRTLGVRPAIGRDFVAAEDAPGEQRVVLLTHALWRRRFDADSAVVGRALSLDGVPHVVAGVLPADFDNVLAPNAQIFRVLGYAATQEWACRSCRHLRMVARLRPDVTREAAAAELNAVSARLVAEHPTDYAAAGVHVVPLRDQVTRAVRPVLLAVLGAVGLVLLIAAANVANLQLARAMRRDGEFAVRAALGAGRVRLARQLLAEGLLLAVLGGAGGLVVARLALPALVRRLPESLPRLAAVRLDGDALAVATAVTLLLGVMIGLVPALHGGRASVFDTLRGATPLAGPGRHAARAGLVVSEVALALMLLAGAGLLSRSLLRLLSVDVGFDPSGLLTLQTQATGPAYTRAADVYANHDLLRAAVLAVPGVVGAAVATQLPLTGNMDAFGIEARDRPLANPELAPSAERYVVTPYFLRTMRIPLLRGRGISDADARDSAQKVVVVSAALAAALWPGEDAVGRQVRLGGPTAPWRLVVGVAGNIRHGGLDADAGRQVYVPERQWMWADDQVTLVVRARGDAAAIAPAVRRAVLSVDPGQPVTRLATMEQIVAASTAQRRLALLLFAAFAAVALLLAAAGIYGVLAGSVTERTREIGLRSALGAAPRDILAMVLLQGARLALAGLALGLAGALALGRFLGALLYAVEPTDPGTLAAVVALLALVALFACLLPARRALRVDPMTALRTE